METPLIIRLSPKKEQYRNTRKIALSIVDPLLQCRYQRNSLASSNIEAITFPDLLDEQQITGYCAVETMLIPVVNHQQALLHPGHPINTLPHVLTLVMADFRGEDGRTKKNWVK
jgi:hypothetical protein